MNNDEQSPLIVDQKIAKGKEYLSKSEYDQAIDCFTEILKIDSEYPLAYIYLGMTYYEQENYRKAIEKLTKGIELAERIMNHKPYDPIIEKITKAYQKGSITAMLDETLFLKKKEELNCSSILSEAYLFRGDSYLKTGSHKRASTDFHKTIELGTNNPYVYTELASISSDESEFEKAIEYNNKAIELNPEFVEAYINRGLAYSHIGNHNCAEKDFSKARDLKPDFIEAYIGSGQNCLINCKYDDAIKYFDKVIGIDNKRIVAFIGRGSAYSVKEEYKEALKDFKMAIHLDSNSVNAYINRGIVYLNKNEILSAIEDFTRAIHLDSNSVDAYINRGRAYFRKEQFEDAIKDYDRVIKLDPENAEAYFLRSQAYYRNGVRLAIINCEQSLHLKSDNYEAREWITSLQRSSRAIRF
jgi:tetratricopeptide (TPR) repeat protein